MSRDMRKYSNQTNIRLIVGAILIIFFVGLGLIVLIYGNWAGLMGFGCLLGAMIVIGVIALLLKGMDVLLKRIDKD